jgi:hypothetical protein
MIQSVLITDTKASPLFIPENEYKIWCQKQDTPPRTKNQNHKHKTRNLLPTKEETSDLPAPIIAMEVEEEKRK